MPKNLPPGAKGIDWAAVRKAYSEGLSVAKLAERFSVSERWIWDVKSSDAKRGEIWQRQPASPGPEASNAEGQSVEPPARGINNVIRLPRRGEEATIVGEFVDPDEHITIDQVLAMQPRVAMGMMRAVDRLLRKFNNGELLPGQNQSEADVVDKIAAAAQRAVEMGRTIGGIKEGTPSILERNEDDGRLVIEHQVIEPKVLKVNEKGRHTA